MKTKSKAQWAYVVDAAVDTYERRLVRYATRLLGGDVDRARDTVQDVFLRLWRAHSEVREESLAQWLFTVCRNRAFDMRRKESRMTQQVPPDNVSTPAQQPVVVEKRQKMSRILSAVETLPEKQQEVVRLRFQEDLSYKEIAGVTGESVTNVGYLLHVAIQTIRTLLQSANEGRDA